MLFVFQGAISGQSLLAPLDLGANFYSKYRWMQPAATGIPQNHYNIDIFDQELPRQYTVYQALHRGEFPWWDPYTDAGRPLVAEAHISATDPLRMALYYLLPFEKAFNWTQILHSFLFGLGALVLLTILGFPSWICVSCALVYQFAGDHLIQGSASVPAAFVYYPFLWALWHSYCRRRSFLKIGAAAFLSSFVIMAGNQQSHVYLLIFAGCISVGYAWRDLSKWKKIALPVCASVFLGSLIALPVLIPQVELFLLCKRSLRVMDPAAWLTGIANLSALFPWALGTFRTIDASKAIHQGALGFSLFIGCAALVLSIVGAVLSWRNKISEPAERSAFLLVAAYFIICSSPLINLLYTRASDLAVLPLILFCARALNFFANEVSPQQIRKVVATVSTGILLIFILCNLVAFIIYPHFQKRLEEAVLRLDRENRLSMDSVPAFRSFQIRNFANEVSVKNPETVFAALSCLALCVVILKSRRPLQPLTLSFILALNMVPILLFGERYLVKQPVHLWRDLLQGGPEQQKVQAALQPESRLDEKAPGLRLEDLYPGTLPLLYSIHALNGYSSFPLPSVSEALKLLDPKLKVFDYQYVSMQRGLHAGELIAAADHNGLARFQWQNENPRKITVLNEILNEITVHIDAGLPGKLIRTDRFYPGWEVDSVPLAKYALLANIFIAADIPSEATILTFRYRPRFLTLEIIVSLMTATTIIALCGRQIYLRRKAQSLVV
jgi:hypothetical protein